MSMKTNLKCLITGCLLAALSPLKAQDVLLTNVYGRQVTSLNGQWQYIIEPYDKGTYDFRFTDRRTKDWGYYATTNIYSDKEYVGMEEYKQRHSLTVPGDWNHQEEKFRYYEGLVWYFKTFDYQKKSAETQTYLYFGAVNYKADVYLNGTKVGSHEGGFTPFNFLLPDSLLRQRDNFIAVKVDNRRFPDRVPAMEPDWWNYGGITRDVMLIEEPSVSIQDYCVRLKKDSRNEIEGWIKLNKAAGTDVTLEIPELKLKKTLKAHTDSIAFGYKVKGLSLWSPQSPKLYAVRLKAGGQILDDKIGFRDIRVDGLKVLLNGSPVFFRGICIQEEIPQEMRRAYSKEDAVKLLSQAKELNANLVRLAHYPHSEYTLQVADSMGLMVWSEIPVFQHIDCGNVKTQRNAHQQLREMITRDRNRASVVIWSIGNETYVGPARNEFMKGLARAARAMDDYRLISSALEVYRPNGKFLVNDPLCEELDLVAVNEYLGWYNSTPDECKTAQWDIRYDRPLLISETGAEALGGYHADRTVHWSEEYQEWYYQEQLGMMERMPEHFAGVCPWILNDFMSPKRNVPVLQEGWNNKGVYDPQGNKKKAFHILKDYYDKKEQEQQ